MSHDIRMSIPIAAPAARVFDALRKPDDLRAWFCEEADVSPADHRYDFWGRHTPGAPPRPAGRHALLDYDAPQTLAYDWALRGGAARVTLTVTPTAAGSTVELHHALPRGRSRREGAMADFWAGSLERLKAWVEKRVRGFLADYGSPASHALTISMEVKAPAADVFRALVDPAQVERYLAMPGKASIDPRAGGRYDIGWEEGGPVRILQFEPGARLAYAWRYKDEPHTVATWTVEPAGRAAKLTLVHAGFDDASRHEAYFMGWAFFLNRIKLLVETDQGRAVEVKADDYEETSG